MKEYTLQFEIQARVPLDRCIHDIDAMGTPKPYTTCLNKRLHHTKEDLDKMLQHTEEGLDKILHAGPQKKLR